MICSENRDMLQFKYTTHYWVKHLQTGLPDIKLQTLFKSALMHKKVHNQETWDYTNMGQGAYEPGIIF